MLIVLPGGGNQMDTYIHSYLRDKRQREYIRPRPRHKRMTVTPDVIERIRHLHQRGMSRAAIAAEVGCSVTTVSKHVRVLSGSKL